ncbi:MAG: cyclic nucleotide-binding domain-containing protein [Bacteroidota bacterium]
MEERLKDFPTQKEEILSHFMQKGKFLSLKKKEKLILAGSEDRHLYIVLSGGVSMSIVSHEGKEKTIMLFTNEPLFDTLVCSDSYYNGGPTSYQVRAEADSIVLQIPRETIQYLIQAYSEFNSYYITNLEKTLALTIQMYNHNLLLSPTEFLEYLYQTYPFLLQRFPAHTIADLMGISPVWLSKIKKGMDRD